MQIFVLHIVCGAQIRSIQIQVLCQESIGAWRISKHPELNKNMHLHTDRVFVFQDFLNAESDTRKEIFNWIFSQLQDNLWIS
jgi:hypothetical protein